MIMHKKLSRIMIELILLATIVGFIPELTVSGFTDLFGPCGFDGKTCSGIQIQGAIKIVFALICVVVSVVIGLYIRFCNPPEE